MYNIRIVPKNVEMSKLQVSKNIDNFFMDSDKLYFTRKYTCREAFCRDFLQWKEDYTMHEHYFLDISTNVTSHDPRVEALLQLNRSTQDYHGKISNGYYRLNFTYWDVFQISLALWIMSFPKHEMDKRPDLIDYFIGTYGNKKMSCQDSIGSAMYYDIFLRKQKAIGFARHSNADFNGPGRFITFNLSRMFPSFLTFIEDNAPKLVKFYIDNGYNRNSLKSDIYLFTLCHHLNVPIKNGSPDLETFRELV